MCVYAWVCVCAWMCVHVCCIGSLTPLKLCHLLWFTDKNKKAVTLCRLHYLLRRTKLQCSSDCVYYVALLLDIEVFQYLFVRTPFLFRNPFRYEIPVAHKAPDIPCLAIRCVPGEDTAHCFVPNWLVVADALMVRVTGNSEILMEFLIWSILCIKQASTETFLVVLK
jgi:hypothetical protein